MMQDRKMLSGNESKTFDRAESAAKTAAADGKRSSAMLAEAERIAAIKAAAMVPFSCGPDIPLAPARGAFQTFRPMEMVPGTAGTARPAGYRGPGEGQFRDAIRVADVFSVMEEQARRAHAAKGEDVGPFTAPLTPAQVQMGRTYRDLVERHGAGGMKCASLEANRGGGSGGAFMDAYLEEGLMIERLRRRIGDGAALVVRRIRPSKRGAGAKGIITDRVLVDMVCLKDKSLSDVLRHHGWAKKGEHVAVMRRALAAALDRMQGYS